FSRKAFPGSRAHDSSVSAPAWQNEPSVLQHSAQAAHLQRQPVSVIVSNARNGTASNPIAAYASRQSGWAAFWMALPSFDTDSAGGDSRLKIPLRASEGPISGPAFHFFA